MSKKHKKSKSELDPENRIIFIHRKFRRLALKDENNNGKRNAKNRRKFRRIEAPSNFSLINNPEEVIKYINNAGALFKGRKQVDFDLQNINTLTPEAIAFFVAHISNKDFNKGIGSKGNGPKNFKYASMFAQSGFYDHVSVYDFTKPKTKSLLMHKKTNNKVEPVTAKDACIKGIRHAFETEEKYRPLYEIIIECMANTNNHAGLNEKGKYDYWIFVHNKNEHKNSAYTFVDIGVGIFESLPVQNYKLFKWAGIAKPNTDLMEDLVEGKIKSRTLQADRGKGFPLIYKHATEEKRIKNFKVISNDVYADFDSRTYTTLKNNFKGTLIYWELENDNNADS